MRQQVSLADVTGFVEEHKNGQRVVKVFNHEQKSKEEFDQLNEALFDSASQANKYANMPVRSLHSMMLPSASLFALTSVT